MCILTCNRQNLKRIFMKRVICVLFLLLPRLLMAQEEISWQRTGGPLGGLGYDVRMRPDNPDLMYVTDAYAGVFISEDGGQHWFPSNQGITTRGGESGDAIPVFSLSIDPLNPDIIWIGTQFARGIFKSTDAGMTWNEKVTGIEEVDGITFRGFTVDPARSDIVYAAAELSSWNWNGTELSGREFDKTRGVVYRTADGGEHWSAIWRGDNLARYIWIDPRNTEVIYISTGIFDREAANSDHLTDTPGGEGIVKSTDGGKTWRHVNTGIQNLYVGTLFMHPENPDILLAGTGNNAYPKGEGVYRTDDGGETWTRTLVNRNINAVEFCISDPNIAYAGSADAIFRSEDGGLSWNRMSGEDGWGAPGVRAGFPIDFQVDFRNPDRIFANNYGGGNFLSTDGGESWVVASQGYTGAQARDIAVEPEKPEIVFCAARSGMFMSQDGGRTWSGLNYPPANVLEWNAVAVDPVKPKHVICSTNWDARLLRSEDHGQTWYVTGPQLTAGRGWRTLVFAPSNTQRIYAGTSAFFSAGVFDPLMTASGMAASNNGGETWVWINDSQSTDANIQHIAVDPTDSEIVYAATGNRGLLKSQNGGISWKRLTEGLPDHMVYTSVAVDPYDRDLVLTAIENGGLYRSIDQGGTWRMVTAGLIPEMKIMDLVFDRSHETVIYLADSRSGVYCSEDRGEMWMNISDGLRTRAVNALSLSTDGLHLYAATEGEGVFRIDLNGHEPVHVTEMKGHSKIFSLSPCYPNPFNAKTTIVYFLPHAMNVNINIFTIRGEQRASLVNAFQSPGPHIHEWDASRFDSGTYLIRVQAGSQRRFQKCLLLK
jgi:photosystem II stability/assembly factor-like uncharacterized protein